jgi:hypothetical protein
MPSEVADWIAGLPTATAPPVACSRWLSSRRGPTATRRAGTVRRWRSPALGRSAALPSGPQVMHAPDSAVPRLKWNEPSSSPAGARITRGAVGDPPCGAGYAPSRPPYRGACRSPRPRKGRRRAAGPDPRGLYRLKAGSAFSAVRPISWAPAMSSPIQSSSIPG